MLRFVLDDYKNQFKRGLKHLQETGFYYYIYLLIYPMLFSWNEEHVPLYYALLYTGAIISLNIGALLSRMYPNQLSKTLLLSPMTDSEKREYLRTAFLLRIGIPMFLYLVFNGISIGLHRMSPVCYLCTGWILFLLIVSLNIYCLPRQGAAKGEPRTYPLPKHYEFWSIATQLTGVFTLMIVFEQMDEPATSFDFAVIIILMLLHFIIFIKFSFTYYKPVMERAIRYEDNY